MLEYNSPNGGFSFLILLFIHRLREQYPNRAINYTVDKIYMDENRIM